MSDVGSLFLEYVRLDRKRTGEGLSVAELERWTVLKRSLTQRFAPNLDPRDLDRRGSLRVPTRLHCAFGTIGDFQDALITNLSRSGVFIRTRSPLEVGARVNLRIRIEDSGAEIEVPGTVATTNVGPSFQTDQAGMGISFGELAPQILEQIDDLYERSARQSFGAAGAAAADPPPAALRRSAPAR